MRSNIFASRMADVFRVAIKISILIVIYSYINGATAVTLLEPWSGDDYSLDQLAPTRITILTGEDLDEGKYIKIYDHAFGSYSDVTVLSIENNIIEVYDYGTGKYRVLTMDWVGVP